MGIYHSRYNCQTTQYFIYFPADSHCRQCGSAGKYIAQPNKVTVVLDTADMQVDGRRDAEHNDANYVDISYKCRLFLHWQAASNNMVIILEMLI